MKKPIIILIVIVIAGLVIWGISSGGVSFWGNKSATSTSSSSKSPSLPTSEKTKISSKISEYKNDELGFSVKYPSAWEVEESPSSIGFIAPARSGKNTVNKLETKIEVMARKCSFPPVTTIKERTTTQLGSSTLNMISMSNSVQGRNYFDRMYTLQKGSICYVMTFSSLTLNPTSKGYAGGELQQVNANNKAI